VATNYSRNLLYSSLASQGTVTATDLDGVDFTLLCKAQRGMPRIIPEQREILIREFLNVRRQPVVALPE
jgi:hypothetical protein